LVNWNANSEITAVTVMPGCISFFGQMMGEHQQFSILPYRGNLQLNCLLPILVNQR